MKKRKKEDCKVLEHDSLLDLPARSGVVGPIVDH